VESGRVRRVRCVYAFEPSPAAFSGLVRHIALNRQRHVVRPIAAAVSGVDGEADLAISDTAGESRLADASGSAATVRVPTVTIDAFCEREGVVPHVIKIDVEGAELDVLRGARQTIRRAGPELALFVEFHPSIWAVSGVTRRELEAELDVQQLKVEPLTDGDPWAVEGIAVRLVRR
jgi:FkbM family methyltransferase